MFRMGQRFDRGEDLLPLVKQRRQLHSNGGRVFCQTSGASDRFDGGRDPIVLSAPRLGELAKWALSQGEYLELTVLCDAEQLGMTLASCINRVADVLGHVAGMPNVIVEVANEPGKNLPPGVDVWQIIDALGLRDKRNRPVLMASGAYDIVGHEQDFDALDLMNNHGARKWDWPSEAGKLGHFVYDGWDDDERNSHWKGFHGRDVHVNEDEPMGCATHPSGSRDPDPNNHGDAGAGAGMGNGSYTFHATSGVQAILFDAVEVAGGTQAFAGADFFPADACLGTYSHDGFPDMPLVSIAGHPEWATEVAGRNCGDRFYVVAAQATQAWRDHRQVQNGWTIVREGGHHGNWLELQR